MATQSYYLSHLYSSSAGIIPTGSIGLDIALRYGGYKQGSIVEIYGSEASGKSTMAIIALANAQAAGSIVAYLDLDNAFNRSYAEKLGIDADTMLISHPDDGEMASKLFSSLAGTEQVDVIVLDSVAALSNSDEKIGQVQTYSLDSVNVLSADLYRRLLLAKDISSNMPLSIFINQMRTSPYTNCEYTPGDNFIRLNADILIETKRKDDVIRNGKIIGDRIAARIVRNMGYVGDYMVEFDLIFNRGISVLGEVFDLGVISGVIQAIDGYFCYVSNCWKTRYEAMDAMRKNLTLLKAIQQQVFTKAKACKFNLDSSSWCRLSNLQRTQ